MIIVQLSGGLGNQMFQYAIGRALSIKNNVPLKLDLSFFRDYTWHEYSLLPFAIEASIATDEEVNHLKTQFASFPNRVLRKLGIGHKHVLYEKSLLYDPEYLNARSPAYLVGYWQCEKYFNVHRELLQKEFKVISDPSPSNQVVLDQITKVNAVSVHIRRGNFVSVSEVSKIHGTSSLEYYYKAFEHISGTISNPVFYVFSDDIAWAKASLNGPYQFVFVDINDAKNDFEDFRLITKCKHHIIANSTFSWWAAWMNPSPHKIIIAPSVWLADPIKNLQTRDIVPETWTRY